MGIDHRGRASGLLLGHRWKLVAVGEKRVVMFLTEEQLRNYVRNRDRRKRAEVRAAIRAAMLSGTPEERA